MYVIKSGPGYFVKFVNHTTLQMTTDITKATKMSERIANDIKEWMEGAGFGVELIPAEG